MRWTPTTRRRPSILRPRRVNEVSRMAPYLPETNEIRELVEGALIQLEEASATLRRTRDRIDVDPDRLAQLDARDSRSCTRARAGTAPSLGSSPTCSIACAKSAKGLARSETRRAELGALIEAAAEDYRRGRETGLPRAAARRPLRSEPRSRRACVSSACRTPASGSTWCRNPRGRPLHTATTRIDFLVSANPGQPLRSISRVASGGELSRISLAVQASASHRAGVTTLIFDEVDAGIGGRVAGIVGRRLRALSDARQVLCVTHLPQIASQAHHHISVEKRAAGNETTAVTSPLSGELRVRELARMLAGAEPTSQSLAHAREMLEGRRAPGPL